MAEITEYQPLYSTHGHERKTHVAVDGKSLCGVEDRYPNLLWNLGGTYDDPQSQFLIDADGFGCLTCRRKLIKRLLIHG